MLLPQQTKHTLKSTLEVIRPLQFCRIDRNISINGHFKVPGLKLVIHISDADAECLGVFGDGCVRHGEECVGGDGHGEHRVEGVVNVFANNVDSSRGASNKRSWVSIYGLKLGEEVIPSWCFGRERGRRVDVGESVCDGDGARHFGNCCLSLIVRILGIVTRKVSGVVRFVA